VEQCAVLIERGFGEEQRSAGIAAVGPLDLDHPGAEIAEAQRAGWPRQELAEIEHNNAVERQCAGRSIPALVPHRRFHSTSS